MCGGRCALRRTIFLETILVGADSEHGAHPVLVYGASGLLIYYHRIYRGSREIFGPPVEIVL